MLYELCEEVRAEFPGFKIVRKDESALMKAISIALMVVTLGQMRTFMTGFVTTIGQTVYVPSSWDMQGESSRSVVIRHERIHMRQSARYGWLLFSLGYLFFPLPLGFAYVRARLEMEAYAESIRATVEYFGTAAVISPAFQERIVRHFTSAEYGWMLPARTTVKRWVRDAVDAAVSEYLGKP